MPNEDGLYTKEELDAEVAGLKKNRDEVMDQVKSLQRQLSDLGGIDTIKTRLKELTDLEAELERLEAEGNAKEAGLTKEKLDEIERTVAARLEKKYGPLQKENVDLQGKVRTLTLDNVIKGLMPQHGVIPERVDKFYKVVKDHFDLTDDDGPILKDNPGSDIGEYIEGPLAQEWPEFYAGTGSSGGGASRSAGGAGGYRRTIPAGDDKAFNENLDAIIEGTVRVR